MKEVKRPLSTERESKWMKEEAAVKIGVPKRETAESSSWFQFFPFCTPYTTPSSIHDNHNNNKGARVINIVVWYCLSNKNRVGKEDNNQLYRVVMYLPEGSCSSVIIDIDGEAGVCCVLWQTYQNVFSSLLFNDHILPLLFLLFHFRWVPIFFYTAVIITDVKSLIGSPCLSSICPSTPLPKADK